MPTQKQGFTREDLINCYDILPEQCRNKLENLAEGMVCAYRPEAITLINSHYKISLQDKDSDNVRK